jgi:protein gp37
MMGKSLIEWTDRVWNPTRGCTRASPGCQNCYAEAFAHRFSGPGKPFEGLVHVVNGRPQWTGQVRTAPEKLRDPEKWREPSVVFVDSMSDLFHEEVPYDYIDQVMRVVWDCPQHFFLMLTKRAERLWNYFTSGRWNPPPNLGLGVSVENQEWANKRLPYLMLLKQAAMRFVSYEPALGPVNFRRLPAGFAEPGAGASCLREVYPLEGMFAIPDSDWNVGRIDWIIVGGESSQAGTQGRPFHLEWARSVLEQRQGTGCAVFVKQMGSYAVDSFHPQYDPTAESLNLKLPLQDKKGGDPDEWGDPGIRIREYPKAMEEWRVRTSKTTEGGTDGNHSGR